MARPTRRSASRNQEIDATPQPATTKRSRKRLVQHQEDDDEENEENGDDINDASPEPQKKQRRTSSGGGGATQNGDSGGGDEGGSGSSGRRRSAGFMNMQSQDDAEDNEESRLEFSNTQGAARQKVASAAAKPSKEVQSEAKDDKKASELSLEERARLIKSMMRFLVMKGLSHEPASKKEMMDVVLGSTYRAKGVLKYVLAQAAGKVKASLGLRVKTVSSDKPYFVKDTYYVINALNHEHHSAEILKGQGQAARGLLTTVLCVVFCSPEKTVSEDELFKKLSKHLDKRIPERPYAANSGKSATKVKNKVHVQGLGDVHDLLAMFVKQHYLTRKTMTRPTADGNTDTYSAYSMGARAALEVGNMQIVTLMAETMGETVDPTALAELEEDDPSQSFTQQE